MERTGDSQPFLPGYRWSTVTGPHLTPFASHTARLPLYVLPSLGTFKRGLRERKLESVSLSWQESTLPPRFQGGAALRTSVCLCCTSGRLPLAVSRERETGLAPSGAAPLAGRCEKRALVQAPARWLGRPGMVRSERCRVPEPGAASERQRSRACPAGGGLGEVCSPSIPGTHTQVSRAAVHRPVFSRSLERLDAHAVGK